MNYTKVKINAFLKGLTIVSRPHRWLGWLRNPLFLGANTISLSRWIFAQDKNCTFNDFFSLKRDYARRLDLYQHVIDSLNLHQEVFDYLEYGVSGGHSFRWWIEHTLHPDNRYFGFDTFEGLPENWGQFDKGDMAAGIPDLKDHRVKFYKGLFQESQPFFLKEINLNNGRRKIVHLDADLFSSTLFALTSLAPYLKKGDVLMFDEFNVPNHEFLAFKLFCDSYYVKTRLIGAVNNYFQVALILE